MDGGLFLFFPFLLLKDIGAYNCSSKLVTGLLVHFYHFSKNCSFGVHSSYIQLLMNNLLIIRFLKLSILLCAH